ncbi:MAG: HK97 family phage prohead protease [Xanthobacteraceae bacterium]|nr:HK97 family phage prohead protease [Xanthobacteraceae bacterium]
MLYGSAASIEIRSEGGTTRLRASFPYNAETELAPGRREVFAPGAFRQSVNDGSDVMLLFQHDMAKPLASRAAGSLQLRDTDSALEIEATIENRTSWAQDFLAANAAGLIRGLSPGFRVAPNGERIERRGNGVLRTVTAAIATEFSAVTKPAYPTAQIEARNWNPENAQKWGNMQDALRRWRV